MAIFANMAAFVTEVTSRTGRPDKSTLAQSLILESTLQLHMLAWNRDIKTFTPTLSSTTDTVATFSRDAIPRLIKPFAIKRLALVNSVLTPLNEELTLASADTLSDYFGMGRTEIYYPTGVEYTLVGSSAFTYGVKVWAFQYPDAQTDILDSWIATHYPYAIIDLASQKLYSRIGRQDLARDLQVAINSHMAALNSLDRTN